MSKNRKMINEIHVMEYYVVIIKTAVYSSLTKNTVKKKADCIAVYTVQSFLLSDKDTKFKNCSVAFKPIVQLFH